VKAERAVLDSHDPIDLFFAKCSFHSYGQPKAREKSKTKRAESVRLKKKRNAKVAPKYQQQAAAAAASSKMNFF